MKASELMIGDWMGWLPTWKNEETGEIEWDGDRNQPIIGKVGMLMKDCTTIDYCDESIEVEDIGLIPLPLTPEILEKNGLEWNGELWVTDNFLIENGYDYKNRFWWSIFNSPIFPINSVHELQHALRLFGIDKEIEL